MRKTETLERGECYAKISCEHCGSGDGLQIFIKSDGRVDGRCFACPDGGRHVREQECISGLRRCGEPVPPLYADGGGSYELNCSGSKGEGNGSSPSKGEGNISSNGVPSVSPGRTLTDVVEFSVPPHIEGLRSRAIPDRGLTQETVLYFGVKVETDPTDRNLITKHYYPDTKGGKLCGYEVRDCAKKRFSAMGDRKGAIDLWGMPQAKMCSNRKLFITEGRLDAMSLFQVLCEYTASNYKHLKPAVVSLTRGAGGALTDIINNREFVESFKEVILVFDNDGPGEDAVKKVLKTFPNFKVAKLPLKDANDMLVQGKKKELNDQVLWKSSVVRQGQVVDVEDFLEEALIRPTMGIPWPWPTATKLSYGIRPNTIHIIGAAPKIGKSDHEYQLIQHLAVNLGIRVGVFDFENPPKKTAKKVASKTAKIDFTKPDIEYDVDVLRNRLIELNGMVRFYDRGASREWEDVKVAIEEMHLLDDICIFTIDPLTAFISRYTSSEANDRLNEIATDMADLVQKYPITIFCYSHVNPKPKGATPHERGGSVLSSEFTGSRAMEKWFHYGWGIQRDRSPDCPPDRKNISEFVLLFDRDFGESGKFDVKFDPATCSYLEPTAFERRFAPTGD